MNYSTAYRYGLTHWGRYETDNISQTTFSNVLSSMKMFELRLKLRFCLLPRVELTSPTLVQIMAWHLPGAKPLSESMTNGTHFAVTITNVSTVTNKTLSTIQSLYTSCYFEIIHLKFDHYIGGKWDIHDPNYHKQNQLLNLERSCWLSLV